MMPAGEPGTRAEFTYHNGAGGDLDYRNGRLRSVRIPKQSCAKSNTGIKPLSPKFRIMARQCQGAWYGVRWDGQKGNIFPIE
jgi:hypothetical protein